MSSYNYKDKKVEEKFIKYMTDAVREGIWSIGFIPDEGGIVHVFYDGSRREDLSNELYRAVLANVMAKCSMDLNRRGEQRGKMQGTFCDNELVVLVNVSEGKFDEDLLMRIGYLIEIRGMS